MASRPFAALGISLALLGGSGVAQAQNADNALERFVHTNAIVGQGAAACRVSVDYMRQAVMNQPMFSGEVTRDPATGKYAAIFIERPSQKDSPRFAVSADDLLAAGRKEAIQAAVQRDCVGNFAALKNHERAVSSVRHAMGKGGSSDPQPQANAGADTTEYTVRPMAGPSVRPSPPVVVASPAPPTEAASGAGTADEFNGLNAGARAMIVKGSFLCQVTTETMQQVFAQTPMFTGTVQRHNTTGELSALLRVPATGEYSRIAEKNLHSPEDEYRAAMQVRPGSACATDYALQMTKMAASDKIREVKSGNQRGTGLPKLQQ